MILYNRPRLDRLSREAVLREHREALQDGNTGLAERIRLANPDLFDDHGEPAPAAPPEVAT